LTGGCFEGAGFFFSCAETDGAVALIITPATVATVTNDVKRIL